MEVRAEVAAVVPTLGGSQGAAGLAAALDRVIQPGDVVLTLGAGDITLTGPELLALRRAAGVAS